MDSFGRHMLERWMLDPHITYLNHGTVGATPRTVLAAQQAIRDDIERQPARYLLRELADVKQFALRMQPRMRAAAEQVARFVGARGDDLVFVGNASEGMSAVLGSLALAPGDEILLTDHGYGAVYLAAEHVARRAGAVVRTVELPFPGTTEASVVQAIAASFTPHTRLLVVDHVTSGSALVLPVREVVARAHAAGVRVLVDGAHAPGALPLDIPAVGADWYTGNLHKWAMAPRGCGILWAGPAAQRNLHPPVISWGYDLGFTHEFNLTGTRDPSAYLAAPAGIEFMQELGLGQMRAYDHAFAWDAARMLCDHWGTTLPAEAAMVGTMATIPLPLRFGTTREDGQRLKDALLYEQNVEIQVHGFKGRVWMRISGQVYNDSSDLDRLMRAVEAVA
ncbi:MAG: aminotransferase class V-fold PLP-dependent enzyme [Candidatus Eisenbacteria bacterium]